MRGLNTRYGKEQIISYTIENIRDYDTGEEFKSEIYLADINSDTKNEREGFLLRDKLLDIARKNKNKNLVCSTCNQALILCGGGKTKQQLHFRHYKDNEQCPIITNTQYTQKDIDRMRYNGAKESLLHILIKEFIYKQIKQDNRFKNEALEKVIKSISEKKLWRKPDVSSDFLDKKIAFEIQLQTTYLNTIRDREEFFKNKKIYIMWFFNNKNMEKFRFSEKDIFYANKSNAFVITNETMTLSEKEKKFLFECCYKIPFIENECIKEKWENRIISVDDLKFDSDNYKVYYYNFNIEYDNLQRRIENKWLEKLSYCKWYNYELVENDINNLLRQYNIKKSSKFIYILLILYSLKQEKAIGWDNDSLIWTLNNFFEHHKELRHIAIKMIIANNMWDKILKLDIKSTFRKKVNTWKDRDKQSDDNSYNMLLLNLFPELASK